MKPHVKMYFNHFDLGEQDFIYCEYSYIIFGAMIKADDIHHILFGANKHDHIDNLMAVSREIHNSAHNEEIPREDLRNIHQRFLNKNPY